MSEDTMTTDQHQTLPPYVAVGKCKGCGARGTTIQSVGSASRIPDAARAAHGGDDDE